MKPYPQILLLLYVLLGSLYPCMGQRARLDSLLTILPQAQSDTVKAKILSDLSFFYYSVYPDSGIQFGLEAADLAQAFGLLTTEANAYQAVGVNYHVKADYPNAILHYEKALQIQKRLGDRKRIAKNYNNIGSTYTKLGDYPKALEYHQKSLDIKKELGDQKGMAKSYYNIGNIYNYQENHVLALELYEKSLQIMERLNDSQAMASLYNNIGIIHRKINNDLEALAFHRKSLRIREALGDKRGMVLSFNNMGSLLTKLEQYDSAQLYQQRSLSMARALGLKASEVYALISLADNEIAQGRYNSAYQYCQTGSTLAQQVGDQVLIKDVARNRYLAAAALKRYPEALQAQTLYYQAKDSLFNEEQTKQMTLLKAQYDFKQEKDAINKANTIKQLALEKDIATRKATQLATYLGLGLSLLLLTVVFAFFRTKQKDNRLLQEKSDALQMSNEELQTANEEIQSINETLNATNTNLSQTLETVEMQRENITASINYAKRIQNAILPSIAQIERWNDNSFVLYRPKDIVSGDFYWLETQGSATLFAAADCTGHGVPGAMVSVICNNALNRSVREHGLTDPGEVLNKTRQIVIAEFEKSEEEVQDGMDIALCAISDGILQYAGAYNPLWLIRNGELLETKADKQPIGKFRKAEPFTTHRIPLRRGDTIYIFSDGYADQFGGAENKKFGRKRMKELLLEIQALDIPSQKTRLETAFDQWKGDQAQVDDVCVIGVRID